jgi:hypothetical protein
MGSALSRTSSVVGVGASVELVEVTQKRLAVSMHSDLAGNDVCVHLTLMPPPGPRTVADPPAHGRSRPDYPPMAGPIDVSWRPRHPHVFPDCSHLLPDRTYRGNV